MANNLQKLNEAKNMLRYGKWKWNEEYLVQKYWHERQVQNLECLGIYWSENNL